MTSATPTRVQIKNDSKDLTYGSSARRLVNIYVEISPAQDATTDMTTYVPNLAAITGLKFNGSGTAGISTIASMATWSTYTVTWKTPGTQYAEFIGYYT